MNPYLAIILAALVLAWAVNELSRYLDRKSLDPELPREFAGFYDADKYRASQEYALESGRLSSIRDTVMTVLTIGFILAGGFAWLDRAVRAAGFGELLTGLLFLAALGLLSDLLATPFQVYRTFVLEGKYGFNRTTPGLFVADKLKVWLLSALLGGPLAAAVLWFFMRFPDTAWLWSWLGVTLYSVGVQYLAPTVILPLFNKFQPLPEGELCAAIEGYARSRGFALAGVYVMDGSKRSTRGNAFFTGFGKKKRIALFDTLINKQTTTEIMAVLAHEIGHYEKGHILRGLVLGIAKAGLVLFLLSLFIRDPGLFQAFGVDQPSVYAGLVFFTFLYAPVSLVLEVVSAALSRRWEYQADRFAARTTGRPEDLVTALKKLSVDNLSNLTPHPLTVFLDYSHPPVLKRIEALRAVGADLKTDTLTRARSSAG